MKRYHEVDGVIYTPQFVEQLREEVIVLRDASLSAGNFQYAVSLSHNIAILKHYKELIDNER